jgi:DNA polymerase delta subunit 1
MDKLSISGMESVRRDNCKLASEMISHCLHLLLIERDVPKAIKYAQDTISDILNNRVDLSLLVISKSYAKADYAGKQVILVF